MEKVILDSNILIEILKNNTKIIKKGETFDIHFISEVTKMELYYGALNKVELKKLKFFLSYLKLYQSMQSYQIWQAI